MSGSEWLSSTHAASYLGVHVQTLKKWARAGRIPYRQYGGDRGHWRFRRADLDRFIRASEHGAAAVEAFPEGADG